MFTHGQDSITLTPMSVQLDTDVGEVNLQDMNLLFYYQVKSFKVLNIMHDIPFITEDFFRYATFRSNN